MKNFYQKLVTVSVCTTLSFTLGGNKAVAIGFNVQGNSSTGIGKRVNEGVLFAILRTVFDCQP
jgi:hypothetical protein